MVQDETAHSVQEEYAIVHQHLMRALLYLEDIFQNQPS